jgi:hypothetical protein
MSDDMSAAFERLRTSAQRLNFVTDTAAQLVKDVETFLEESGVGIYASVLIHYLGHPDDEPDGWVNLDYRRLAGGKFRISVVRVRNGGEGPDIEEECRAWSECNREEKLKSFEKLPELMVALAKEVENRTARAEAILALVAPQLPPKKKKGGA